MAGTVSPSARAAREGDDDGCVVVTADVSGGDLCRGRVFRARATLTQAYPFKSPSVAFLPPVPFHPNVNADGAVCADLLGSRWASGTRLVAVFEQILPLLLQDPNASDPMNGDAAALLMREGVAGLRAENVRRAAAFDARRA